MIKYPNLHEEIERLNIDELVELRKQIDKLIECELIGRGILQR